jgi:hypothetical protein
MEEDCQKTPRLSFFKLDIFCDGKVLWASKGWTLNAVIKRKTIRIFLAFIFVPLPS